MLQHAASGIRRSLGVLDWLPIALLVAGLACVLSGLLPTPDVGATMRRILPPLLFLATILVLADHTQLLGLLIGVNVGSVIIPWASLATMLWYERCVAAGLVVPLRRFMLASACLAVAGIALSTAALLWA